MEIVTGEILVYMATQLKSLLVIISSMDIVTEEILVHLAILLKNLLVSKYIYIGYIKFHEFFCLDFFWPAYKINVFQK